MRIKAVSDNGRKGGCQDMINKGGFRDMKKGGFLRMDKSGLRDQQQCGFRDQKRRIVDTSLRTVNDPALVMRQKGTHRLHKQKSRLLPRIPRKQGYTRNKCA
jgi:hypothetical protein